MEYLIVIALLVGILGFYIATLAMSFREASSFWDKLVYVGTSIVVILAFGYMLDVAIQLFSITGGLS